MANLEEIFLPVAPRCDGARLAITAPFDRSVIVYGGWAFVIRPDERIDFVSTRHAEANVYFWKRLAARGT